MEAFEAPKGLIAELITPFESDGAIDIPGLKRLVERVSPHVQGIFLASPRAGEGAGLSLDQRLILLKETMFFLKDHPVFIFFWITGVHEEQTMETASTLQKWLKDKANPRNLFIVDTPLLYHSNRSLSLYYKQLSSIIRRPIILHNDPEIIAYLKKPFKRNNIRTAILKELSEMPEITGLIFCGSLERGYHYQRACRKDSNFRIYDGDEIRFLDYPSMSGAISVGANLAPKAWEKITQSSLLQMDQKYKYPDHLQQIWKTGDCLRTISNACQPFPVSVVKKILKEQGIIKTSAATSKDHDVEKACVRVRECMGKMMVDK